MAKYNTSEIIQKLVDLLSESSMGLSGVEISERLGINRITMTKYLDVFAAEGLVRRKKMGNLTLWFAEEGAEQFQFPDDYSQVQKKYQDLLLARSENQAYTLIKNCLHSDATIPNIITEIILPTIAHVRKLYNDGKIGNSELNLLNNMISNSIQLSNTTSIDTNPKKNAILIAADQASAYFVESTSAILRNEKWNISMLGDMSPSINVLFDLDLQKFLGKIWKQRKGIMIIVVFSETEEGLNFFAESINSIKLKVGKKFCLVLCGKLDKKTSIKYDLIEQDLDAILRWSQDKYENL